MQLKKQIQEWTISKLRPSNILDLLLLVVNKLFKEVNQHSSSTWRETYFGIVIMRSDVSNP